MRQTLCGNAATDPEWERGVKGGRGRGEEDEGDEEDEERTRKGDEEEEEEQEQDNAWLTAPSDEQGGGE